MCSNLQIQHGSVNLPFLIVGNCCDDYDRRMVSYEEGASLAAEYNCPFYECSAKTGQCVENVFLTAASKALHFVNVDVFKNLIKKGDLVDLQTRVSKLTSSQTKILQYSDDVRSSVIILFSLNLTLSKL